MTKEPRVRAEQQGDGQPENLRELEDESGGAALAEGGQSAAAPRAASDAAQPTADAGDGGGDGPDRMRGAES